MNMNKTTSSVNTALNLLIVETICWVAGKDYFESIEKLEADFGMTTNDAIKILKELINKAEDI